MSDEPNDFPNLTVDQLDAIAPYLDDVIREDLHSKLAPCHPGVFLTAYLAADPSFPAYQLAPGSAP